MITSKTLRCANNFGTHKNVVRTTELLTKSSIFTKETHFSYPFPPVQCWKEEWIIARVTNFRHLCMNSNCLQHVRCRYSLKQQCCWYLSTLNWGEGVRKCLILHLHSTLIVVIVCHNMTSSLCVPIIIGTPLRQKLNMLTHFMLI